MRRALTARVRAGEGRDGSGGRPRRACSRSSSSPVPRWPWTSPPSRWSGRSCTTTSTRPRTPEPSSCRRAGPAPRRWAVTMAKTQDPSMTPDTELFCVVASTGAGKQVASGQIPATCDPGTYSTAQVRCNTKICSIPCPVTATVQHDPGHRLQGRRLRLRAVIGRKKGSTGSVASSACRGVVRGDAAQPDGRRLHGRPHHQHGRRRPRGHAGRHRRQPRRDGPDAPLRRLRRDAQEQGDVDLRHGGHHCIATGPRAASGSPSTSPTTTAPTGTRRSARAASWCAA